MPRFEKARDGIEYVVRIPGEITVDDPVGAHILKRVDANPNIRTRFGAKQVRYDKLLEDFENSDLPKEYYDALMNRMGHITKPLAQIRDERVFRGNASKNGPLLKQLFGEEDKLSAEQIKELTYRLGDFGGFKGYVKDYISQRLSDLPNEFSEYKEEIRASSQSGNMKGLVTALTNLRRVVDFHVDYGHGTFLKWHTNRDLMAKYSEANKNGSIFEFLDVAREVVGKHNKAKS
ncbi:hypothetical protein HN935_00330 [archaeon]|jgi:hypothetical protein|nr:hypothetical protein [archaeon]